jgi:cytochrome c biogenesis protein
MNKSTEPVGFGDRLVKFFASIKLTVVLLLVLAATSVIGTLIPQNQAPAVYVRAFGEVFSRLLFGLGFFDLYHSWWFQALLVLLTLNIVVCSLDRLKSVGKIVFQANPKYRPARFKNAPCSEFASSRGVLYLKDRAEMLLHSRYRHVQVMPEGKSYTIFGERWRWTRLGVYVVHLSVVMLLLGGLVGSLFGFDGFVQIPEGESVQVVQLRNSRETIQLPFAIRCNDFNVSFYPNGAPEEFRSNLDLLVEGEPVYSKSIIVNDPLRYQGINIFQSSYGEMAHEEPPAEAIAPVDEVVLNVTVTASGLSYQVPARIGEPFDLPETMGKMVISEFKPQAQFHGQNIGEALVGIITPVDGAPLEIILPIRFPNFDKMRRGAVVISVLEPTAESAQEPHAAHLKRYWTGLQVTKDPGVWLVYTGFILMILGCFITFFMSHQQLCLQILTTAKGSRVVVAGTAHRGRLGMQHKVDRIAEKLAAVEQRAPVEDAS